MRRALVLLALAGGCALPEPSSPSGSELSLLTVAKNQGCALSDDGVPYCWGEGTDSAYSSLPQPFAFGQIRFSQVVATGTGICGVLRGGGVACAVDRDAPLVHVTGEPEFTRLVAGAFVCGVTATGEIWCFSKTGGPATKVSDAGELHGLSVGSFACALNATEHAECWTAPSPTVSAWPVVDTMPWQQIIAMSGWACGHAESGDVFCWTYSPAGVMGAVTKVPTTNIFDGTSFVEIYGSSGYLGLISDGGRAYYKSAGSIVFPEGGGHHWQYIAPGDFHVCGVLADGRPACFGQNSKGQLGDGTKTVSVNARLVGGGTP